MIMGETNQTDEKIRKVLYHLHEAMTVLKKKYNTETYIMYNMKA